MKIISKYKLFMNGKTGFPEWLRRKSRSYLIIGTRPPCMGPALRDINKPEIVQTHPALAPVHLFSRAAVDRHVIGGLQLAAVDASAPPAPAAVTHVDFFVHIIGLSDVRKCFFQIFQ